MLLFITPVDDSYAASMLPCRRFLRFALMLSSLMLMIASYDAFHMLSRHALVFRYMLAAIADAADYAADAVLILRMLMPVPLFYAFRFASMPRAAAAAPMPAMMPRCCR